MKKHQIPYVPCELVNYENKKITICPACKGCGRTYSVDDVVKPAKGRIPIGTPIQKCQGCNGAGLKKMNNE